LLRRGYLVSGIELSAEACRRTEGRLKGERLRAQGLLPGRFEVSDVAQGSFDMIFCHRVAHLLVAQESITRFAANAAWAVRSGGILCLGVRNDHDLNPAGMTRVADKVYEYAHRPGHRIRYWDDRAFHETFGDAFTIVALHRAIEPETKAKPVACHLTVMVARRNEP
jgi:hypothetical protein